MRYWLPIAAAVACIVVGTFVGPLIALVLTLAAFGFVFDVATKLFESAGKAGRLTDHRQ